MNIPLVCLRDNGVIIDSADDFDSGLLKTSAHTSRATEDVNADSFLLPPKCRGTH